MNDRVAHHAKGADYAFGLAGRARRIEQRAQVVDRQGDRFLVPLVARDQSLVFTLVSIRAAHQSR